MITTTSFGFRPSRRCVTSRRPIPTTIRRARARRCAGRSTSSPQSSPEEVAQRVTIAGVEIVEVRISHLAYAPEIAQAMLRRQQANAVVAARARIVEGSVGMVEMALARLLGRRSNAGRSPADIAHPGRPRRVLDADPGRHVFDRKTALIGAAFAP